ncbi:MAG: ATPase [Gracilimonas sp.]|uniref:BCAM0308 family protein n=1 Tax=Gracilimonas sp. TaxID=1974203 RepID=UPI00198EB4A9|nr:BCAM0308 family protein [Gracilimonas sp.]MBD3616299.1 ATPase [Gracilimonas sp.]
MKRKKKGNIFKQERTRIFKDDRHDPYQRTQKLPDPTLCPSCGSIFTKGRWTWESIEFVDNEKLCPACQRIQDNYPAGYIEVEGSFFQSHKEELLNLIRNLEKKKTEQHPLERIITISESDGKMIITTTGMHLPKMIGDALKSSYEGDLDISYDAESMARVHWTR